MSRKPKKAVPRGKATVPIVSSAMGFIATQIGEFEADRIKHGFTDIEFVRSQDGFTYDVKCGSQEAKKRYAKHLGYEDFSSVSGGKLGKEELEMARQLVAERYDS